MDFVNVEPTIFLSMTVIAINMSNKVQHWLCYKEIVTILSWLGEGNLQPADLDGLSRNIKDSQG